MDSFNSSWPSPPDGIESLSNDGVPMDMISDLQESFEPLQRARSNTWPLPRPDNFTEPEDSGSTKCSNQQLAAHDSQNITLPIAAQKKNSSRRNAWGNFSYADLITQAINSAVDNRLTLSQIYEWMVQNVPYFKDKGDSNSSAGWKNSIRHNLSLHNRFMRVQNEGTGKSSWWMLNPDAKPGKSVRRRAASMETSKYEKRRGRVKKQVENLKNSGLTGISGLNEASSPSSSISEGLDMFPNSPLLSSGGFQLSPDFRQRASSNASSVGRLSPIPSVVDIDSGWSYAALSQDYDNNTTINALNHKLETVPSAESVRLTQNSTLDQLAGSLADDLTLQNEFLHGYNGITTVQTVQNQPPPPYQQPSQTYSMNATTLVQTYGLQQQCPLHRRQPCTCAHNSTEVTSPSCISPSYPRSDLPQAAAINTAKATAVNSILATKSLNRDINDTPFTLMGQVIEALNNQPNLDDLSLNIDSFQGGLECNVDELIQQELNYDGMLDINIPISTQYPGSHLNSTQNTTIATLGLPQELEPTKLHSVQTSTKSGVTSSPSWVH